MNVQLLGFPRDVVHRHRVRCSRCNRKCYLGERQHDLFLQSEGDAAVFCLRCGKRLFGEGPFLLGHLGNPAQYVDGSWPAGELRLVGRARR